MKALGWYLDEQDLAQVSINLTDYEVTPLHVAFEECSKDAKVYTYGTFTYIATYCSFFARKIFYFIFHL